MPPSLDLTEPSTAREFIRAVEARNHRIEVLVCNAGAYPRTAWTQLTLADLRRSLEVNLIAHAACIQAVTPHMMQNHYGRIIAVSSVLTQVARIDLADYIATAVVFLASAEAEFVTGQSLTVDGGWHLA